jgi:putrescine aminotransferase
LRAWDAEHIIHPQLVRADRLEPVVMVKGEGAYVTDITGRRYLDATGSGLWCGQVGHGRAELAEAARSQIAELEFFGSFWNYSTEPAIRLARKLTELATPGIEQVYFTTGGSESNEIAFMMARLYHHRRGESDRNVIIGRKNGYHGITYASRAATGIDMYHTGVGPLPEGFIHLSAPDPYRMPDCTDVCVAELEEAIERIGESRIAAMVGEPILGVGGMLVPPEDYWPRIHEVLKAHGILLMLDEVVSGYGRTGSWWGADQWGIEPDFLNTAKGLTSGYFPLGATLVRDSVADVVMGSEGFPNGFTYSGHAVGCAIALENLAIIEREHLIDNVREMGAYLLAQMQSLLDLDVVGEVRGRGLMLGIELVVDKETKEPALALGKALGSRFVQDTGVFVRNVANALVLSPPFVFDRAQCDAVVEAIGSMLERCSPDGTIRD